MKKALSILKKNQSIEERAESILKSVERNIKRSYIESLEEKKQALEDKIYELENINLSTNLNQGQIALTRDQVEEKFSQLLKAKYDLKLLQKEYEIKSAIYDEYFNLNFPDLDKSDSIPDTNSDQK